MAKIRGEVVVSEYEAEVLTKLRGLPKEKVKEVLEFTDFLRSKRRRTIEKEYFQLASRVREKFKKKGLTKEDVCEAIKWARG